MTVTPGEPQIPIIGGTTVTPPKPALVIDSLPTLNVEIPTLEIPSGSATVTVEEPGKPSEVVLISTDDKEPSKPSISVTPIPQPVVPIIGGTTVTLPTLERPTGSLTVTG